ncbi:hypothetical protein G7Y89_g329 [Cudoniella acicularis]|uniref:Uncharacterized protein n=1 Tax=Cudoniella acicularis TaxID=354080 RepID=A0A8H4RYE4_9HELO|nr:hypothetical protein G7Y89_g329 [Cudoniella acicularis]
MEENTMNGLRHVVPEYLPHSTCFVAFKSRSRDLQQQARLGSLPTSKINKSFRKWQERAFLFKQISNIFQASEPDGQKRKRSRPSEWWAATASSSSAVQQDDPPALSKKTPRNRTNESNYPPDPSLNTQPEAQPGVLRRKISRPSDWWAASPSTPLQQNEASVKKDGRGSKTGLPRNVNAPLTENPRKSNSKLAVKNDGIGETKLLRRARKPTTRTVVDDSEIRISGAEAIRIGHETHDRRSKDLISKKKRVPSSHTAQPTRSDSTMPKRRGRSSLPHIQKQAATQVPSQRENQSKRGRPPNSKIEPQSTTNGTNGKTKQNEELAEDEPSRSFEPPTLDDARKRSRKSKDNGEIAKNATSAEQEVKDKRRKLRSEPESELPALELTLPKHQLCRNRTRNSDELIVETASSAFARTRRTSNRVKPTVDERVERAEKTANFKTTGGSSKAVVRTSSKKASAPDNISVPDTESSARKRKATKKTKEDLRDSKRRRVSEIAIEGDIEELTDGDIPLYQHLAAVTRKVPRHIIEERWGSLSQNCVGHIERVLVDVQRPVVIHFRDENKRIQASAALQMVSRRLLSKISKGLPFPPGTTRQQEDDFDFEKITDRRLGLEAQLTAAADSNKLLVNSLSQEMAWLESEKAVLAELEANAKSEASLRKQVGRKLHPFLQPESPTSEDGMDDLSELGFHPIFVSPQLGVSLLTMSGLQELTLLQVSEDEDLNTVAQDLDGHMDSLHGNVHQVRGLIDSIAKAKAAVQTTLFVHLDDGQYEDVILGSD